MVMPGRITAPVPIEAAPDKDRVHRQHRRFERAIRVNGAWQAVIGQDNPRTQKDAILKVGTVIDIDSILEL
jgi:hypothetical protein